MIARSIQYQTYRKDTMMKARKIENGLALAGAIVVLIGVSFAADNAFAQENADVTTKAVAIHNATDHTLSSAEKANAETAAEAVASLALENRVELDIQLEDRTSTLIVRGD
jgi:parvulin-like peptidyl-prolyl isomerase